MHALSTNPGLPSACVNNQKTNRTKAAATHPLRPRPAPRNPKMMMLPPNRHPKTPKVLQRPLPPSRSILLPKKPNPRKNPKRRSLARDRNPRPWNWPSSIRALRRRTNSDRHNSPFGCTTCWTMPSDRDMRTLFRGVPEAILSRSTNRPS